MNELLLAEKFEIDLYFQMARKLYDDCSTQSCELFDIAAKLTSPFSNITTDCILEDSRIIKILRYCMVPVLSQMKLGQLVDLPSTQLFEDNKVTKGDSRRKLELTASKLLEIIVPRMDVERFLWLNSKLSCSEYKIAMDLARKWTCSLMANQNSNTSFRNWRKELQETSIANQLINTGFVSVDVRRIINDTNDLLPGQFSKECRIRGRNVQKADFVIRLRKSKRMMLIEAKAIGVKIDAFKRIKECREKFDDWRYTFGNVIGCGVVLSGFIPESEYKSLADSGVKVFWEHNIKEIGEYVELN